MKLTTNPVGQAMGQYRQRTGLSLYEFRDEVCAQLPREMWPSVEKIRRYESASTLPRPDWTVLQAIANVLGVALESLMPAVRPESLHEWRDLVSGSQHSRCNATSHAA